MLAGLRPPQNLLKTEISAAISTILVHCIETSAFFSINTWYPALQINIPLPFTMNRKIKKPPVKINFRRPQ